VLFFFFNIKENLLQFFFYFMYLINYFIYLYNFKIIYDVIGSTTGRTNDMGTALFSGFLSGPDFKTMLMPSKREHFV
jgi:hypothetical protein